VLSAWQVEKFVRYFLYILWPEAIPQTSSFLKLFIFPYIFYFLSLDFARWLENLISRNASGFGASSLSFFTLFLLIMMMWKQVYISFVHYSLHDFKRGYGYTPWKVV